MRKPSGGGRRIRVEPRRTTNVASALRSRTTALAILALVVALGLLALAAVRSPGNQAANTAPRETLLSSVAMSCPAMTNGKDSATGQVLAAASLDVPSAPAGGQRSVLTLPDKSAVPGLDDTAPGAWQSTSKAPGTWTSVLLKATGGLAPGTVSFTAATAPKDLGSGLAVGACPRPVRESWFVGAGSSAEHQTALLLTNTTDAPAVVAVNLLGSKGSVEAVGGNAIEVEPGAVKAVSVDDLAAGEPELAIHTVVERGSVAVSAVDVSHSGTTPSGSEWIPSAVAPSRRQTVAGVMAKDATRTLLVANPGDRTATATVTIAGSDGRFNAKGLEKVEVDPHSVASLDIPASVEKKAFAVALESDEPVTAAVRMKTPGSSADTAYAIADRRIHSTTVMPLDLNGSGNGAVLMLTSGGTDADSHVEVTAFDATGKAHGTRDVTVAAGRTVTFDPTSKSQFDTSVDKLAYLTIDPGTSPVFASASYAPKTGISVLPLSTAPSRLPAPAAQPEN